MNHRQYTPGNWYHKLDDGRCFSTAKAGFVDEAEALQWAQNRGLSYVPPAPVDENGAHSAQGLRIELERHSLSLGTLMRPKEGRVAQLAKGISNLFGMGRSC